MSTLSDLQTRLDEASADYEEFASRGLNLDITRAKPSPSQLDLAAGRLTAMTGDDSCTPGGAATRNYGGLEGISELREIFAPLLRVPSDQLRAGGNASLTFMAQALTFALIHGSAVDDRP